jgi:calpain-9
MDGIITIAFLRTHPPLCCRMALKDFKMHSDKVEICNLTPDALEDDAFHRWEVTTHQGSWVRGSTAGGCRNFLGR